MQLFPLILFGIATAFSPGPNNIMTSYTAFNFGFRKAIPTMLGVIIGWTLLIILLQLTSAAVFQKYAFIQTTTQSLLESGRPFRIISIDNFDEYTLGELFAFSMLETILTSNLLGLNPFNQPAIEKAKKLTKNYL